MLSVPQARRRRTPRAARWCASLRQAILVVCLAACQASPEVPPPSRGRRTYDASPIDITAFPQSGDVVRRILYMPFGEAALRLGSLSFTAQSRFVFSEGGQDYEQDDRYEVTQDSSGNFHVLLRTPKNEVEVYLVGESFLVRQDRGHLRSKPRRDVDAETWCDLAFASVHQALELFGPRLALADPSPGDVEGRRATRYRLTLAATPQPLLTGAPPQTALPVAPLARWREQARPLDLTGELWVDAATGVLVRLRLRGRVEIADRPVRPTELTLEYSSEITKIGKVAAVAPPSSIAEYTTRERPKNLLSFFKDHIEEPAAKP